MAKKDTTEITLTLKGDVTRIVEGLVHGFPIEVLEELAKAFQKELDSRKAMV
jgi:hypothetical protein